MGLITSQEFLWDPHLTTFVTGFDYTRPDAIAFNAFTPVPVLLQSAEFKKIVRSDWLRDEYRTRPLGGEVELTRFTTAADTYNCQEYGLGFRIDDRTQANNNFPGLLANPRELAAQMLSWKAQIRRDRFWAINFMKSGVWSTNLAGVTTGENNTTTFRRWDDYTINATTNSANSDVIGLVADLSDAMNQTTGFRPNRAVLGAKVYRRLRRHPQLLGTLGANEPKLINAQRIADILEIEQVLVPRGVYNSADEGQADNIQYIVNDKSVLLLYRAPLATTDGSANTAGAVFGWNGLLPGMTNPDGVSLGWQRIPLAFSDQLTGRMGFDEKVISPDLGIYMDAMVS